ncbi:MAG: serine/threonine-protein kinase [Victivallales bacterium]
MTEFSGRIIDGYKIGALVGKGSIGTVYSASDSNGGSFAVKIMELNPFLDASALDAIIEGAIASSKVSECARIVKVYKAAKTKDFYYVVMEFMQGGTLERLIGENGLPVENKIKIGLLLAETIACIHSKGIIHGDLKPGNIMLDSHDTPYLTDFYYSTLNLKRGIGLFPQGTPRYMSPEQAMGQFITTSSDIYSFGVLYYELLTGAVPYKESSSNIAGMITTVLKSEIVHPSGYNRKLDRKLCAILLKMLQKKIEDRYQNMQQVVSDLKGYLEGAGSGESVEKSIFQQIKGLFTQKKR